MIGRRTKSVSIRVYICLAGDVDFERLLASRSQVVELPDDGHHTRPQEDKDVEVHEHEVDKSIDAVRLLADGICTIG